MGRNIWCNMKLEFCREFCLGNGKSVRIAFLRSITVRLLR